MHGRLTYQDRLTMHRAGYKFPDPRDEELQVASIVLLWRQMAVRRILLKKRQRAAGASRRHLQIVR